MSLLDRIEDYMARPGRLPRHSFLGWTVKACAALDAVAEGTLRVADLASACSPTSGSNPCPGGPWNDACCCLLYPDKICNSDYYDGQCPCACAPSNPWEWTCRNSNGCHIVCGECYNCGCSYAYQLCSVGCPCLPQAPSVEGKLLAMQASRRAALAGR